MSRLGVFLSTLIAMIAFAGNSLLCRMALKSTHIDAATFTSVRIISGALALSLIVLVRRRAPGAGGSWLSALALFVYATAFSFAYIEISVGTGALLLFGAVQITMTGYGLGSGERLRIRQAAGLLLAFCGLVGLLLPGLSAPPLRGGILMIMAGVAWGIYSLRGKGSADPSQATAGNFLRAVAFAIPVSVIMLPEASIDASGIAYAVVSGALTSGVGYAVWYKALKDLSATIAATVQLSVPVLAAVGGLVFLGEHLSLRLLITSAAVLGGIAVVVMKPSRRS